MVLDGLRLFEFFVGAASNSSAQLIRYIYSYTGWIYTYLQVRPLLPLTVRIERVTLLDCEFGQLRIALSLF